MSLRSGKIPSLAQGVSQQPDELRLPTQLERQDNCFSSLVEGLIRRPPTEHIAKVSSTSLDGAFMHVINRDTTERYQVVATDTGIQVFDLDGTAKTVHEISDSFDYLTCDEPKSELRALTIADYTIFVNTTMTPAMEVAVSSARDPEAIVLVRQGEYGSVYNIVIDGTVRATYTTHASDVTDIATDNIATELYDDLVAWAGAGFTFTRKGSVIHISKTSAFTIRVEDSQGGTSLYAFKDKTPRFSELPAVAPNGFVIAIDANPETEKGKYYIKAVSDQAGETFGQVTWQECIAPGITYAINPDTMPHALIRQVDGSFNFEALTWVDRRAGDNESNEVPSFIGSPIADLTFYKNRLGFMADEYFVFSETGEYFNFFRTTVTQILDTDPIDSRAVSNKVSILKRAIPLGTHLVMFSDQTQFKMPGETAMTPRTFRADPVSGFEGDMTVAPVDMGKSLYFVFNYKDASGVSTGYAGVKELFQDQYNAEIMDANDITEHVPSYIPEGVHRIAGSTLANVCVVLTDGDPSRVYVNRSHKNDNDQKVQNAWFRWSLGDSATTKVLSAGFIDSTLFLLVERDDEVFLEKMSIIPQRVDAGSTYVTHLDRRVDQDNGFDSITYDSSTNRTTFSFNADVLRYDEDTVILVKKDGTLPVILDSNVDEIVVKGDWSAADVWMGQVYDSRARLSKIFLRIPTGNGGSTIDPASRLQLLRGHANYSGSGDFTVSVTPEGRSTSDYIFTGRLVGDSQSVLGQVALRSGRFQFAILARNDQVTIELSSDGFLPFKITSIEWEGTYTKRSR